jgi:uncharacterized membrane protein (DUF106 family)
MTDPILIVQYLNENFEISTILIIGGLIITLYFKLKKYISQERKELESKIESIKSSIDSNFKSIESKTDQKWNSIENKLEKMQENIIDIDRRLCRLEGAFASKDCCMIKDSSQVKKAE